MITDILGVRFHNLTPAQAVDQLAEFLTEQGFARTVVTPNPEIVMRALQDQTYRDILNLSSLVLPDGIGIVIASRILGGGIRKRVAGIELVQALFLKLSAQDRTHSVFLLGGKPGVAERAAHNLAQTYSGLRIAGTQDGYFDAKDEESIAWQIGQTKPDILLVGLGFPKQEYFIDKHRAVLNAKVSIGCGGSLDVFAGTAVRAPLIFRKLGLEWFYRLIRQPSRLWRMSSLPLFMLRVIWRKLTRGGNL